MERLKSLKIFSLNVHRDRHIIRQNEPRRRRRKRPAQTNMQQKFTSDKTAHGKTDRYVTDGTAALPPPQAAQRNTESLEQAVLKRHNFSHDWCRECESCVDNSSNSAGVNANADSIYIHRFSTRALQWDTRASSCPSSRFGLPR